MPTYLCHGFRWYRRNIRIFVILNSLDDCAPDWIVGRTTAATLLSQLAESFSFVPRLENEDGSVKRLGSHVKKPAQVKQPAFYDDDLSMPPSRVPPPEDSILMHEWWSPVKLLEEYDENETEYAARPYAYIADHVVRVDLGADIAAEMAMYDTTLKQHNAAWFEKLRENVQPEEQLRWYVVVCDDTEREVPEEEEEEEDDGNSDKEDDLTETEDGSGAAQKRVVRRSGEPAAVMESSEFHGNKDLPSIPPPSEQGEQVPAKPALLDQDSIASGPQPAARPKKRISIRRLFSRKEG